MKSAILGIGTLEGELATAEGYLEDPKHEGIYAGPIGKARIDAEIAELERQVRSISAVLADPAGARERLRGSTQSSVDNA